MRILSVLPLLLMSLQVHAKTVTIAVIDTGIDKTSPNLCKMGHKSFLNKPGRPKDDPLVDTHGHGTHIAGLISQNAGVADYCLVSMKYYSDSNTGKQNLENEIAALRYAINIKVDFINFSGGGPEWNEQEHRLITIALNKGIKVVVAAGNEGDDLDKKCDYFPACYDKRLVVVGNLMKTSSESAKQLKDMIGLDVPAVTRAPSSNYGAPVNRWEIGTDCLSTLPGGKTGYMSGTSQATAIATGKLVKERLSQHK